MVRNEISLKRDQTKATRRLQTLFKGAKVDDYVWLSKFQRLRKMVFVFRSETASVERPGDSDFSKKIPWPIVWLLARYHKKHIFINQAKPKIERLTSDLESFVHKAKWRWVLRKQRAENYVVQIKQKGGVPCNEPVDAELIAWLKTIENKTVQAAMRSKGVNRNMRYGNCLPIVRVALKLLEDGPWAVTSSDKDGGFCIMTKDDLREAHLGILKQDWYAGVRHHINANDLWQQYQNLTTRVQNLEGEAGLARKLNSTFSSKGIFSKLKTTTKTHKEAGKVTHRNVHSSANWQMPSEA